MTDTFGVARRAVDWLFRDRTTGRYVAVQWPNLRLLAFFGTRALEWALGPAAAAGDALHWAGSAVLLWWAADELARGVNPFRRLLGGGVVLVVVGGIVSAVTGG